MTTQFALTRVTISAGQSISNAMNASGHFIKRIFVPASTQGYALRIFHLDAPDGTAYPARDTTGAAISMPFTAGECIEIDPRQFDCTGYFQLQTITSSGVTPQVQTADRALTLVIGA